MQDSFYSSFGKRWFDIAASLIGLILLSPVFIVISLLIKLVDGGLYFINRKE